jgi:hypothetical protein
VLMTLVKRFTDYIRACVKNQSPKKTVFGTFDLQSMAILIQGAIGEYYIVTSSTNSQEPSLETYCRELI